MAVIALSGWKGSGKDTVAEYLVKEHGYIRNSFAESLKGLVALTYGIPHEDLYDQKKKEEPLAWLPVIANDSFSTVIHHLLRDELKGGYWTPRALCILEGSIKRSVNSNHWTRSVVQDILNKKNENHVISDLRYKSEVDILKMMVPGIKFVRIERDLEITTMDPSERDLDHHKFDVYIPNKSSKEKLYENVDSMLSVYNIPDTSRLRLL